MRDLINISILDLIPPNIRTDPQVAAAAQAIDAEIYSVTQAVSECLFIPRIDDLSGAILDHLAWQCHVDFYDTGMSDETKRALIKQSPALHAMKGTPFAMEQLITAALDEPRVQEWFEYGGDPYRFRVVFFPFNSHTALKVLKHQELSQYTHEEISNKGQQAELITKLTKAVDAVKNKRSHFEGFVVYGTYAGQRSYTHEYLSTYTHAELGSGIPL